jgi:hypothetical protein
VNWNLPEGSTVEAPEPPSGVRELDVGSVRRHVQTRRHDVAQRSAAGKKADLAIPHAHWPS